jgi:hypothetical protein
VLQFTATGLTWWLIASGVWESGRAIRQYLVRGTFPRSYPVAMTSIVGIGFVSFGIVNAAAYIENLTLHSLLGPTSLPLIVTLFVSGLALVIGAGAFYQYRKLRGPTSATNEARDPSEALAAADDTA